MAVSELDESRCHLLGPLHYLLRLLNGKNQLELSKASHRHEVPIPRFVVVGMRVSLVCKSSSAYLASAASTRSLRAAISDQEVWEDEFEKEILEARKSTLPGGEAAALTKQKTWDVPSIVIDKTVLVLAQRSTSTEQDY